MKHLAAEPDLLLRVPLRSGDAAGDARPRLKGGAARCRSGWSPASAASASTAARSPQLRPDPARSGRARLESPGEALIYLQQYGVFDTAYAAAFSLGRALALADAHSAVTCSGSARRPAGRAAWLSTPNAAAGRRAREAGQH